MIQFRNLKIGQTFIEYGKPLAIGAFDLGGDLIATCRDFTDSEIKNMHESGFVEDSGINVEQLTANPNDPDSWEIVVKVEKDKERAMQRILASLWIQATVIQDLIDSESE